MRDVLSFVAGGALVVGIASAAAAHRPTAEPAAGPTADGTAVMVDRVLPDVVTVGDASGSAVGTGFVFDSQGLVLTNDHVIAAIPHGVPITIELSAGAVCGATVVGRATGFDLAVIRPTCPGQHLDPLPVGDSDTAAIGDTVIAVGAPFALHDSVTRGILSGKDRLIASGGSDNRPTSYLDALQSDAPIDPGNSGGPLINTDGEVIGINSAFHGNVGFAIPINQAIWVADTIAATGRPIYADLGIVDNDAPTGHGAQISPTSVSGTQPVQPGGPAAIAGLKPGDIITALDGTTITSSTTLRCELSAHKPGERIDIQYSRNGRTIHASIILGVRTGE